MIDKNKTKELEWDKELEKTIMEKLLEQFHCKGGKTLNGEDVYLMTKSDIDNLLTQQRTELLEEIKKDIQKYFSDMADLCFPNGSENGELIGSTHYYQLFGNELLKKLEKKKQNTNLLNKKDE